MKRKGTADGASSGRPIEISSQEMVDKIHGLGMEDRRIRLHKIVGVAGISYEWVHDILHEGLKMKKLSVRLMLPLLTPDQKRTKKDISKLCQ